MLNAGIPHYERAVQLDSNFLEAWSQLARALAYNNNAGPTVEAVERNRVAAERAMMLGPNRAEGHLAMAQYLRDVKLDYEGARTHYDAGLKADPNNADLLLGEAGVDAILGRFDDAFARAQQAVKLDPRSVATMRRVPALLHDDASLSRGVGGVGPRSRARAGQSWDDPGEGVRVSVAW